MIKLPPKQSLQKVEYDVGSFQSATPAIDIPAFSIGNNHFSIPFFIFGVILIVRHYPELDDSRLTLVKAFVAALFYDLSFLSNLFIPFVIYLWSIPKLIYRSIFNKRVVNGVFMDGTIRAIPAAIPSLKGKKGWGKLFEDVGSRDAAVKPLWKGLRRSSKGFS